VGIQQHVLGFHVAVDDVVGVRVRQSGGDGGADAHDFFWRQVTIALNALLERFALDQFHGEKEIAVALADVVAGDDVGVVELGRGAGFQEESADVFLVFRQASGQDLQGDDAVERNLAGLVDGAHAAFAQFRDQFVVADARGLAAAAGHTVSLCAIPADSRK
jgi:hypothetical protein